MPALFRRESLEQILPLMTILPMAYNLTNGALGSVESTSSIVSISSDSISTTSSDSAADEIARPLWAAMSDYINNPIENFRVQAREEFPFIGDFRPRLAFTNAGRDIYANDLERFGRGRGQLLANDSLSDTYNTPSSESFMGRGRGVLGRGRGVFTTSSSEYEVPVYDPRAGRGRRRGMEAWGIGGRGGGRGRGSNRSSFRNGAGGSWERNTS